jgi:glycosyltransferase involved in cell wall biosynthesis
LELRPLLGNECPIDRGDHPMDISEQRPVTISIVTATYNCAAELRNLVESLRAQSDRNFEWVVADGGSTDGTLEFLRSIPDIRPAITSQPDFGIYDALNRAIRLASGGYYIVAGADDRLATDAIANFRRAIEQHRADMVIATVMHGRHHFKIKKGPSWLVGEKAYIAHHSLGTAFRKDLHEKFGLYSRKFPIAADSLFVLRACKGGATRHVSDFVAGLVGCDGVSEADWAGSATEIFRVQLIVGCALIPQVLLLLLRILKGSSAGMRWLHSAIFRKRPT